MAVPRVERQKPSRLKLAALAAALCVLGASPPGLAQPTTALTTGEPHHSVADDAAEQFGEDAAAVPPPLTFRPWAQGVSEADQQRARDLFREGNRLLRDSLFAQAIGKYQEALAIWDHPAIHYNHALALSTLDQPFKTRDELVAAMKHGAGPLGEDQFQQAKRYQMLVEKQLAYITIECGDVGAVVSLNGKPLFTAPGRYEDFVLPGEQLVSAEKAGHISDERVMTLIPGKPATVHLGVYTESELTRYERKWPQAVPWVVTGAGAVLAGVGAWFLLEARDEQAAFDKQVTSACSSPGLGGLAAGNAGVQGCSESTPGYASLVETRDDAERDHLIGITTLAVGGAALVTGAVLLYVNRAQAYRLEPREMTPDGKGMQLSAAASPSAVMLTGRGTF